MKTLQMSFPQCKYYIFTTKCEASRVDIFFGNFCGQALEIELLLKSVFLLHMCVRLIPSWLYNLFSGQISGALKGSLSGQVRQQIYFQDISVVFDWQVAMQHALSEWSAAVVNSYLIIRTLFPYFLCVAMLSLSLQGLLSRKASHQHPG